MRLPPDDWNKGLATEAASAWEQHGVQIFPSGVSYGNAGQNIYPSGQQILILGIIDKAQFELIANRKVLAYKLS